MPLGEVPPSFQPKGATRTERGGYFDAASHLSPQIQKKRTCLHNIAIVKKAQEHVRISISEASSDNPLA